MNYDEYVRLQTEVHGQLKKPWHYRVGERRAIDWFFRDVPCRSRILDVGCGTGTGIKRLYELHFEKIVGVELNKCKVEMCQRKAYDVVHGDIATIYFDDPWTNFEVVWLSHSFEHMFNPEYMLQNLYDITKDDARFFFVMPYPDINPNEAHFASEKIGLHVDDKGETLVSWFDDNGLEVVEKIFDNFREPEIWLKMRKK